MKWLVLLLLFSGTAKAITVSQLIDKFGKQEVTKFILERSKGKLSVLIDGQLKKAHMPSLDYVNAMTINKDLASLGITVNQIDEFLSEKRREIEEAVKAEEDKKLERQHKKLLEQHKHLEQEARIAKEAEWLKQDNLRERDKFDLEVERLSKQPQTKTSGIDSEGQGYVSPSKQSINGNEAAIQSIINRASSSSGTIEQVLEKKASGPSINDLGWTTAPYQGGTQVERTMLQGGLKLIYRWMVSPSGRVVKAVNDKAKSITK